MKKPVIQVVSQDAYKMPSMARMMKIDDEIEELRKSGKPLTVLRNVKTIVFKKNRSSKFGAFCYQGRYEDIILEIFEITYGKIFSVTYYEDDRVEMPEGVQVIS